MLTLKFSPDQGQGLKVTVEAGRYLIVDYGREGWDATFTSIAGEELALPPAKGGRFHSASRHAIATCQDHYRRLGEKAAEKVADGSAPPAPETRVRP